MTNKTTIHHKRSFLTLLAKGQFAEAEKLLINNPSMREMVLHLPALRHTRFFKERIRFYREYARKNKMVSTLRHGDRQQLRDAFAQSHCKTSALKRACENLLQKMDANNLQRQIKQMRLTRLRRKRQKILGLF